MKFRRILGIPVLAFAGWMVVVGGPALSMVQAASPRAGIPKAESDAERYVLAQLQQGLAAEFGFPDKLPEEKRKLRATFLEQLLTHHDPTLKFPYGISIEDAIIVGDFNLSGQDITYDVNFLNCTFEEEVELNGTNFAKLLNFSGSTFNSAFSVERATVADVFGAAECHFNDFTHFGGFRVGIAAIFDGSAFKRADIAFRSVRVGGSFSIDGCEFNASKVDFGDMHVEGVFSAKQSSFYSEVPRYTETGEPIGSQVSFAGGHFGDVFLNGATFDRISIIDFTRMQANSISLDDLVFKTPTKVEVKGVTFKVMSPADPNRLGFLLARYDAQFYSDLEESFRTHGHPDEADTMFISRKRAERRQGCVSFWRQCDRGAFAWSLFQDALAGYGKRLENLLYWSFGFLILGTIVFWKKDGMRLKDERAAEYAPTYQAFWYSLDLFLPIIKLGEADVWTPKHYRRWANFYRKVHIIIGSLFVPIGLAAWTGIIK